MSSREFWIHESRICAEDGYYGPAVFALAQATPELADELAEIYARHDDEHAAYSEALTLVVRSTLAPFPLQKPGVP